MKHPLLPAAAAVLCLALGAAAMEPPRDGLPPPSSRKMAQDLRIGNENPDPALVRNMYARLGATKGTTRGPKGSGLPASGSPAVLVVLIDFDDYPARPQDSPDTLRARIFGSGGAFPYESLTAYYDRSSFGKLHITGDIFGWVRVGKRADATQTYDGREELVKKALLSLKGADFAKYDNNGDGYIDYLCVIWAGPVGEWGSFWWGYAPTFADSGFTVGGKKLRSYSWQWTAYQWDDPASAYETNTLIHETGHSLGLPDYYDYKAGVGPEGGVGGFDMMDATNYDHNCLSKTLLGWSEPRVVTAGGSFTLKPAAEGGDCVLLLPPSTPGSKFGEFFLVERRTKTGNDARLYHPGGVVVWHVDASLNDTGTGFKYNNQTAEHKLLKFVEADGLEQLEKGERKTVNADDFFKAGGLFGPATKPSSALYTGRESGVSASFSGTGNAITLSAAITAPAAPVTPQQAGATNTGISANFKGW